MAQVSTIPFWVKTADERYYDSLLRASENVQAEYRPKRGWLMEQKAERITPSKVDLLAAAHAEIAELRRLHFDAKE